MGTNSANMPTRPLPQEAPLSVRTHILSAALLAVGLAACAQQAEEEVVETAPAVDLEAEEQAIRDISAAWLEASRAGDAQTIANFFVPDGETIFDGQHIVGRDAIRADIAENFEEDPDRVVSWATTSVVVAGSGDLAVERGSWTEDPDGAGEAPEERGEYVTTYVKTAEGWKVLVDAGTTVEEDEGGEM
jgi:uncharacterized protein (TIGR02246 family)